MLTLPLTAKRASSWRLLVLALLACLSWPAVAWNAAGHRLVACIAWDHLDGETRAHLSQLLRQHPDSARWLKRAGNQAADSDRAAFIESSTWPDEIRKDQRFYSAGLDAPTPTLAGFPDMERRRDWHYVNRPLSDAAEAPGQAISGQLEQALVAQAQVLGSADDASRSYALPWLIHLVGDAHQPLHSSVKIDAQGKYDRLGTGLSVSNPFNPRKNLTTLHAFWDDLPGPPWLRGERLGKRVQRLIADHPPPLHGDVALWRDESHRLLPATYPVADGSLRPIVSESFNRQAQALADRRIVDAGYRLGWLLETNISARVSRETQ